MNEAASRESADIASSHQHGRNSRSGGQLIVDALAANAVDRVFCVPGESYLDVLDALYSTPQIEVVVCRHEGAAANMAEADGKATGRPGICFVTRGPGATHASVGVHIAFQDSTPMILFVGQVEKSIREREAFQEIDFRAMFGTVAKWTVEIDDPKRIPELVARAFRISMSGRPGPVVIALPEDVLAELAEIEDVSVGPPASASPTAADYQRIAELIDAAKAPLVIVGGGSWTQEQRTDLERFATAHDLPVAVSFRRQDALDNLHPNYVGHLGLGVAPALSRQVKSSDLLIVVGSRLGDITTSAYTLLDGPMKTQKLIHIYPDPDEIGRVFQPVLGVAASVSASLAGLAEIPGKGERPWRDRTEKGHRDYLAFSDPATIKPPAEGVDLARIVALVGEEAGEDAVITNGAGNYTVWVHRFHRFRTAHSQYAPTNGTMGYGLPAAVAAKLRHPDKTVVCFAGDGCFLMYPQEMGTALAQGAAIIVIIVNNGRYGTIRMHQEKRFPGRPIATDIENPDFQLLARSLGAHAERVETTDEFLPAFERARRAGRPAVIEVMLDPDQLTPDKRIPSAG